jgi:RNA polymerase sigma-70 factor (ECF subfamily)
MELPSRELTQLLRAWSNGDEGALHKLIPLVYRELHSMARRYMANERPGHTLSPTALVNEAFLRLLDSRPPSWQDRAHFFAVSAQAMRRILVDWARARRAQKRDGSARVPELDQPLTVIGGPGPDILALEGALKALSAVDERKGRVVELRFFGGLSAAETAEVLKISTESVLRDWKLAKAWLRRELDRGNSSGK